MAKVALLILVLLFTLGFIQTSPPLRIEEADGSPRLYGVSRIRVSNGTLAKVGQFAALSNADASLTRVATQFDKTSSTAFSDVTGLTADVVVGKSYKFEVVLYTTSDVLAGVKFTLGGTATATDLIYEAVVVDALGLSAHTRATALGTTVGAVTAATAALCRITGTITIATSGTLTIRFAQNVSNAAASSVLVGSTFTVTEIP